MSLQHRANEVLAATAAEEQASSSHEMLSRGQQITSQLNEATAVFARAANLREELGFARPSVNPKALKQALSRFETDLAKSAVKAVDYKSAGNAQTEAKTVIRQLEQWASGAWGECLNRAVAAANAADSPDLQGRSTTLFKIQTARQRLRHVLRLNPLTQLADLEAALDVQGIVGVRDSILERADALDSLLVELKSEDRQLSEAVRAALKAAGSAEGLPLADVTNALHSELAEAGVIDGLTVRLS